MSGQRNYIYLNRRPKSPGRWEDISCGPLEVAVNVFMGLLVLGILGAALLWCVR